MKQKTFGTLALLGAAALAGCYSYAGEAINNDNYNTVSVLPVFAYIGVGDSTQMIVRLTNDANNGTLTSYTVSNVGSGVAVHYQSTYRPLYSATNDTLNPTGDKNAQSYYIVGLAPGRYAFTLTPTINTGVSTTVNVLVHVKNLGTALSKHTAALGDTVVLSAGPGAVFSQTSAVSFTTGPIAIIARAPDSTTITFIAGPGITGPATVTNVGQSSAPTVTPVTLVSNDSLASPALTVAPTTVSNAAPGIGQSFTLTLGAALRFIKTSKVLIGGTEAGISNVAADSSSATITPALAADGTPAHGLITYTNIALSFLNSIALSLPGDKSVTVTSTYAGGTIANAGSIATAPTVTLPKSGRSVVLTDSGAFVNSTPGCGSATADGCRIYKIVVDTNTIYDVSLTTQGCGDVGVYLLTAAGAGTAEADKLGQCPDARTETGTTASLAAGTYYIAIEYFDVHSGYGTSQPVGYYTLRITAH